MSGFIVRGRTPIWPYRTSLRRASKALALAQAKPRGVVALVSGARLAGGSVQVGRWKALGLADLRAPWKGLFRRGSDECFDDHAADGFRADYVRSSLSLFQVWHSIAHQGPDRPPTSEASSPEAF